MSRITLAVFLAASTALLNGATISIAKKVELQAGAPRPIFTSTNWVYGAIPARSGGYFVLAERTNGCALLRLEEAASIAWERPVSQCHSFFKLVELADGSILYLASSRLVRFGQDGSVLLDTALEGGNFFDIIPRHDGFLLAGAGLPPLPFQETIVVQLVSTNFSFMWRRFYPGFFETGKLMGAPSGGYVYGNGGGGRGGGIVQVGTNGAVELDRSFAADNFAHFCPVRGGGYLLVYQSQAPSGGDKSAPSFGGFDYWLVRIGPDGRKLWDRSYGGVGDDLAAAATELEDGGFVVLGTSYSEGISGNKGVDGAGVWILKLDGRGLKETEHLFSGRSAALFSKIAGVSVYAWPASGDFNSLFRVDLTPLRRVIVSSRTTTFMPYNLDVSTNLVTWAPLVTGFVGDLDLKEPLGPNNRFYRVVEP